MNDKIVTILMDTMLHKDLVLASCWKMANYYIRSGEIDKAIEIIKRGWLHDNSKFGEDELTALAEIDDNRMSMRDASKSLPPEMKAFLKIHYEHNTHHPEHWDDVAQMPEMDVVEMCCDWHARSVQYGTNLIEFVNTRQANRFNFPQKMFEKILEICNILVS
ncbi:MAG: hypothetical protein IKF17_03210 [Clostridia bacterium]|nr:hypothetical protein [Clostridia bacterium]